MRNWNIHKKVLQNKIFMFCVILLELTTESFVS